MTTRSEGDPHAPGAAEAPGPDGRLTESAPDPWTALRAHTPARIALGRAGTSLPTAEVLRFAAAHAQARDAVHVALDVEALALGLETTGLAVLRVASAATDRADYLRRPDHGRTLARTDGAPHELDRAPDASVDLCLVVADGLSALAAQRHAHALVAELLRCLATGPGAPVSLGPLVVATQARVALADEIGAAMNARLSLILLGERPGLGSPDSLGAYLTWDPRPGRLDAQRNCVSNIRPEGLAPELAARRLAWWVRAALQRKVTGLELKDESPRLTSEDRGPQRSVAR